MTVVKTQCAVSDAKGFGDHNVAFNRLFKHTTDNWAELVLITHDVEKESRCCIKTIGELPEVGRVDNVLRAMNDLGSKIVSI